MREIILNTIYKSSMYYKKYKALKTILKMISDNILARIRLATISNPVLSKDLETDYNIKGESLRSIIHELRKKYPIGSSCKGYFFANNRNELIPTIEDLRGRANSINSVADYLDKQFTGQEEMF